MQKTQIKNEYDRINKIQNYLQKTSYKHNQIAQKGALFLDELQGQKYHNICVRHMK